MNSAPRASGRVCASCWAGMTPNEKPFLVTAEANWTDPAQNDEAISWARAVWDAMERHSTGGVYLNFPGLGEEEDALARAGYGVNFDRLVALKAKYDPDNLFRMNINIPPVR